jgi:hypothetical protein
MSSWLPALLEECLERFTSKNNVHGALLPVQIALFAPGTAENRFGGPRTTVPQTAVVEAPEPDGIVKGYGVLDDQFRDVPNRRRFGSSRKIFW